MIQIGLIRFMDFIFRRRFQKIFFWGGRYDRIITIAAFEHILNLPDVVATTCRLLKKNGVLCIAIPNEGRLLWKIAYSISTGLEFKLRYGLDYEKIMNYEHCNTADEIEEILRYFYSDVKVKLYGITRSLSLYRYIEAKNPNFSNIKIFMEGKSEEGIKF